MIDKLDPITANQLRDRVIAVHEMFISGMFSTELKFASDYIKCWFKNKYKRRFLELDRFSKVRSERENPIDGSQTKCKIYDFKLSLGAVNGFDSDEITYFGFIVKRKHMFFRHIYETEEIEISKNIKDLENYNKSLFRCLF